MLELKTSVVYCDPSDDIIIQINTLELGDDNVSIES
jgi:hypothetical protein